MHKTFDGGVYVPHRKSLSGSEQISVMPAENFVKIPVSQNLGKTPVLNVNVGDKVKKGELIAKADEYVSSNVFSSVSGVVKEIKQTQLISGLRGLSVLIENDFAEDEIRLEALENPTREQIVERVKEAGIVGMGGAAFPTQVKLNLPSGKACDVLVINGAECEPYITCDHAIMREYADQFVEGVKLIARAVDAKQIIIGIEDNKQDVIDKLSAYDGVEVVALKAKYPQGGEKQLIFACTGRRVKQGGLPIDVGVVAHNVHTAFSIYRAVKEGLPCYERIMTVSGKGIKQPKNMWVRTGTTIEQIAEFCGGMSEDTIKVLNGGPMMGVAQSKLDVGITKSTSALLFVTGEEVSTEQAMTCINCAKCARVCPMKIMPMYIDGYALVGDFANSKKYGANACIECGCCAYICPSKRPLVQSIRLAKKIIRERKI